MGKTSIEYTDEVCNPLFARPIGDESVKIGTFCEKPDPEGTCQNCWAEVLNLRFGNKYTFDKANRSKIEWIYNDKPMQRLRSLNADKRESERNPGNPLMVFCCDTFDLFQPSISDELRNRLFDEWDKFSNLTLQIQTTYPAKMSNFINTRYGSDVPSQYWFGMSVGTQEWLKKYVKYLISIKSKVRYLIFEPLLEIIDLSEIYQLSGQFGHGGMHCGPGTEDCPRHRHHHHDDRCEYPINWVILGGESGASPRPFYLEHVLGVIRHFYRYHVPVLFKQAGAFCVTENINIFDFPEETKFSEWGQTAASARIKLKSAKGKDLSELPEEFRVRQFPRCSR